MPLDKTQLCLVCKRNKQRYVNGCCGRCGPLVEAEGTHDLYGVPKLNKSRQRQVTLAAEYNKLIGQRLTQKQIAQLWQMTDRQVSSLAYRWRKSGLKVAYAWGNQIDVGVAPKSAARTIPKIAEHGVGWGVTKCECELCGVSRRAMRVDSNRRYRKRRKAKRQAAAKLAAD